MTASPALLFARFWQANIDSRAAAVNAGERNFSAMRFHHRAGDGEAKTGTARFSVGHERFEKFRQYLSWNANTGIGNAKHDLVLNEVGSDGENSAANHGFAGVFNQAREHANKT